MADLGAIGTDAGPAVGAVFGPPRWVRGILLLDAQPMMLAARDTAQGTPAAPSLRFDRPGSRTFWWKVEAGERTITVAIRKNLDTAPKPRVVVRANGAIGVSETEAVVADGLDTWQDVTITVNPTLRGVLEVVLDHRLMRMDAQVWFDYIRVT